MGFGTSNVTAAKEIFKAHSKIIATKHYHVEHKGRFEQKVDDTANDLPTEKVAQSHNSMGGFCQSVTVPEILTELLKSAPNANKKVSDRAKDPAPKAGKATSEIFKKL